MLSVSAIQTVPYTTIHKTHLQTMSNQTSTPIAVNTDICSGVGSPELALRAISEGGFTHLHWCHQWCTDFLYSTHELKQYKEWFSQLNLKLLDIHGSQGQEKCWNATEEYRRKAGVELVVNRLEMMDYLEGTGSLMMHAPCIRDGFTQEQIAEARKGHEALRRSLDELMPVLEKYDACIAIENMPGDSFEMIAAIMKDYPAKRIGITYDSGHGHIGADKGMDNIEALKDRLQALHLHDNNGSGDQHQPPFFGTLDWQRLAKIIKTSSYAATGRPLSYEIAMVNTPFFQKGLETQPYEAMVQFTKDAHERMMKVQAIYENL